MYSGLYEKFKSWYCGGRIYFYSDPHFADQEMKHLRANYIGDQEQVDRINKIVHKNDTLVLLGDIGELSWVKKLKAGYKVLIAGNHDTGLSNYKPYFNEIYEGPLFISDRILLSHEPLGLGCFFNIHGHDHAGASRSSNFLNVCAERIDYCPIALEEIVKAGRLKEIANIHRITIDEATNKKERKEH